MQGAVPKKTGQGFGTDQKPGGNNSGISSPLTETDYNDREYHPDVSLSSSDGLFSLVISPIASIKFLDADNRSVEMRYDPPSD